MLDLQHKIISKVLKFNLLGDKTSSQLELRTELQNFILGYNNGALVQKSVFLFFELKKDTAGKFVLFNVFFFEPVLLKLIIFVVHIILL